MDNAELEKALSYIKEMQSAAYKRGWNDALKAINKAAHAVVAAPNIAGIELDSEKDMNDNPFRNGSDAARVYDYVRNNPGRSGMEIIQALNYVDERTIRTALHRMKLRGFVQNLDGRWYLTT